ncbi:MAG: DMT family transporter [Candidatus Kariarchaeaceae archaeon]
MNVSLSSPRVILGFGVLAVTSSSFIIKYAEKNVPDYNPYALAFTRVFLTGLISLSLISRLTRTENTKPIDRNDLYRIILAGGSLASHFGFWFDSLFYDIPIGVSLSLTNTAPIFLVILVYLVYGSIPTKNQKIAIGFVIIGSAILFLGGDLEEDQATGLLLALASAVGFAVYLLMAKDMVPKLGLWRYFGLVNLTAAIVLLPWIYLIDSSLIVTLLLKHHIWLWGILLALIPGICGHAVYNFAMSKVPPVDVGIATLGEPVLGTIFAWIIFDQSLSFFELIGIFILILAIGVTLDIQRNSKMQSKT